MHGNWFKLENLLPLHGMTPAIAPSPPPSSPPPAFLTSGTWWASEKTLEVVWEMLHLYLVFCLFVCLFSGEKLSAFLLYSCESTVALESSTGESNSSSSICYVMTLSKLCNFCRSLICEYWGWGWGNDIYLLGLLGVMAPLDLSNRSFSPGLLSLEGLILTLLCPYFSLEKEFVVQVHSCTSSSRPCSSILSGADHADVHSQAKGSCLQGWELEGMWHADGAFPGMQRAPVPQDPTTMDQVMVWGLSLKIKTKENQPKRERG